MTVLTKLLNDKIDELKAENERLLAEIAHLKIESDRKDEIISGHVLTTYQVCKQAGKSRAEVARLKLLLKMIEDEAGEEAHGKALDEAFEEAERWLEMADVVSEEEDPDTWNAEFEARFHCAACTMRGIGNILAGPLEQYIAWARTHPVEKAGA